MRYLEYFVMIFVVMGLFDGALYLFGVSSYKLFICEPICDPNLGLSGFLAFLQRAVIFLSGVPLFIYKRYLSKLMAVKDQDLNAVIMLFAATFIFFLIVYLVTTFFVKFFSWLRKA